MASLKRSRDRVSGQSTTEYALVIAIIAVLSVGAIYVFGSWNSNQMNNAADSVSGGLSSGQDGGSSSGAASGNGSGATSNQGGGGGTANGGVGGNGGSGTGSGGNSGANGQNGSGGSAGSVNNSLTGVTRH
jgi:hypothetical protein